MTATEISRLKEIPYWREREGQRVVDAWRASGLSLAEFARRHGILGRRIRWWAGRLGERPGRGEATPEGAMTLLPVRVIAPAPPCAPKKASTSQPWPCTDSPTYTGAAGVLELVLASGHVVRVRPDFDEAALRRLVRVLGQEAAC
jgi:hypothetical protein